MAIPRLIVTFVRKISSKSDMRHKLHGSSCHRLCQFLSVMLLLFAQACSPSQHSKSQITVSIPPQKFILEQIVGDKIRIESLLNGGSNPENYEPGMTHLMALEKSKVYFTIGNIGFEDAVLSKMQKNNPDLLVVNSMSGVKLLTGTHIGCTNHNHSRSDSEDVVDPHTWSSVKNVKLMASNMYDAVVRIDPGNKNYYHSRYEKLLHRLDSIDESVSSRLAPLNGAAFVVWHPSLSYFADDYGLKQIVVGRDNKEATAVDLKSRIDEAINHGVKVFFIQKEFDSRQALAINGHIGANVVSINPMNENWESEIDIIVSALTDGRL